MRLIFFSKSYTLLLTLKNKLSFLLRLGPTLHLIWLLWQILNVYNYLFTVYLKKFYLILQRLILVYSFFEFHATIYKIILNNLKYAHEQYFWKPVFFLLLFICILLI